MDDRPLHPKPLFFSAHAVRRMVERGFSTTDVKRILYTGDVAESTYQPPRGPYRYARQLAIGTRVAKVIFTQPPMRYDIITVEWLDE